MNHPAIPLDACMWCLEGRTPHQEWHPTRRELLKIGKEMTARVRAQEERAVAQMADDELVAYGIRMRRLAATAAEDGWPDFARELVAEWVSGAEKEWRWRQRAASLGADTVVRSGGTWTARVERVKREVDLLALIAFETGQIKMRSPTRFSCRCPFHDDHDPSLDVDTQKGVWLCRSCTVGGDALRYVELSRGYGFADAVRYLEERLGITPPEPARRIVEM